MAHILNALSGCMGNTLNRSLKGIIQNKSVIQLTSMCFGCEMESTDKRCTKKGQVKHKLLFVFLQGGDNTNP